MLQEKHSEKYNTKYLGAELYDANRISRRQTNAKLPFNFNNPVIDPCCSMEGVLQRETYKFLINILFIVASDVEKATHSGETLSQFIIY